MAKSKAKYGNDIFQTISISTSSKANEITYWDLWILLLIDKVFNCQWNDLVESIIKENNNFNDRYNRESMISHINHLRNNTSNLNYKDIILGLDEVLLKKQLIKAKKKVMKLSIMDKEKSYWMQHTPRAILAKEALKINYQSLPISPDLYIKQHENKFNNKDGYNEDQAYDLSERLDKYIDKSKALKSPDLFIFYRTFLSVLCENLDYIDDSLGQMGMLSSDVFKKYISISWRELKIEPIEYFTDLIKFIIWDNYCITDEFHSSIFVGLSELDKKLVLSIIKKEMEIFKGYDLGDKFEQASCLIGHLK